MDELDWMDELGRLVWAVRSLQHLSSPGSSEREILDNATRGIAARLQWAQNQAKAERDILTKR
jgi:hypothetical protein